MFRRISRIILIYYTVQIIIYSINGYLTSHSRPFISIEEFNCDPCVIPSNSTVYTIDGAPKCLHPGQPIFSWPSFHLQTSPFDVKCALPVEMRSNDFSFDRTSNFSFAKYKTCLLWRKFLKIEYEYRCDWNGEWRSSTFYIKRESESASVNSKRKKRWLQRRNSQQSPIHFQQDRYFAKIPENAEVGTSVIQIQAKHDHNSLIYYSLTVPEDSRSLNSFSLDTVLGEIKVAKLLDRETLGRHVLKVTAYEGLHRSVSASTTVVVDLIDVQDNSPIFERASYFAEIREDAPIGTTVTSVFARDLDDGDNGLVEYRLEEYFSSDKDVRNFSENVTGFTNLNSSFFTINANSGVIQTVSSLDRESASIIRFKVIATDHGTPPMASTALVEINVLDVNDNTPKFVRFTDLRGNELEECNIGIPENITIPSNVLTVHADDPDSGINGKVHYSIVTSTIPIFSVDYETGTITLRSSPNPRLAPLSLLIRAKDGGHPANSVTVQCTINVFDVNDHRPKFLGTGIGENVRELSVEENIPSDQELARVYAIDEDSGRNGEIRYFLESLDGIILESANTTENITDIFELNEVTGVLSSKKMLDRESQSIYKMKVIAQDRGEPPLHSSLALSISVKDVNDNAPKFPQDLYELRLPENVPRGTELLNLQAADLDLDQKLTYQIEHMSKNLFTLINIGGQGAILSLTKEFSKHDEHLLVIISATDQGGLQGRCNVSIAVADVNSAPVFVDNPFSVHIPENSRPGFHVHKMKALDFDRERNSELHFFMDSTSFSIEEKSGLIVVQSNIDRELQSVYLVNIFVSDNGDPPMNATTALEIVVDDVNDNAPFFVSDDHKISISEDTPVGTSFFQIKAEDADEGTNAIVDYFLDENDKFVQMDKFRLDHTSGTLRVNNVLDREAEEWYILPVIARDRGQPSLSNRTLIRIELEDVNDNAPQFEHVSYDFWVAENSPSGSRVGIVTATDSDRGDNARIKFKIFGGSDAKFFEIEANDDAPGSVRIVTRGEFDFESPTNKFFIELQANSGQLSSIVPVNIHVSDVNDNAPQLKDFTVLISHFVHEDVNMILGNIPAFDPDFNATLEYAMEPNDLIAADSFGVLTLLDVWQHQIQSSARVCVSDGPNIVCAQCRIIYVFVDQSLLADSVSVDISGLRKDEFLDFFTFQRFLETISTLSESWLPEDVNVFSIHEYNLKDGESHAIPHLNVSFFVSRIDVAISSWRLKEAIVEMQRNISNMFTYSIQLLQDETCGDEPCPYFQICHRTQKYVYSKEIIETDSFLMHSLNTVRSFRCECPTGFTTVNELPGECNQRLDLCYSNPCTNNGTCVPLENTYRCECTADRTGPNCEFLLSANVCMPFYCHSGADCRIDGADSQKICGNCKWAKPDTDKLCRLRSISFNGDGYLIFPLALPRLEWQLELEFSTVSLSGVLIYAGSDFVGDFFQVYIKRGVLTAEISLGGDIRAKVEFADWRENRVNDGEWHKLIVEYYDRKLRLSLDNCDVEVSLKLSRQIGSNSECAAEAEIKLPPKCADPSVPCHRFLDVPRFVYFGGRPRMLTSSTNDDDFSGTTKAKRDTIEAGFIGCIKNVQLNSQLVHFSEFSTLEQVGGGVEPGCRKFRPDLCAFQKPCYSNNHLNQSTSFVRTEEWVQPECEDRWMGHLCKCPQRIHSSRGCDLSGHNDRKDVAITFTENSYVIWRLSKYVSYPIALDFEFRTRQRSTQLIALEFEVESQHLLVMLESGQTMVLLNSEKYVVSFIELADGVWHSLSLNMGANFLNITVDHLYSKSLNMANYDVPAILSAPRTLYTGLAPSFSHPYPFVGCIRNVELSGAYLKIQQQLRTKSRCVTQNACASNSCPKTSKCQREWDRHTCKCLPGHVGDLCVDVCSVKGICGQGGTCVVRSSSDSNDYSYDCICPEGRTGRNCERDVIPKLCPQGWFGSFPHCRPCDCSAELGFLESCHPRTGMCACRPGTYLYRSNKNAIVYDTNNSECVPCECGHGAQNGTMCDALTGQCQCVGEASGRRCDQCSNADSAYDFQNSPLTNTRFNYDVDTLKCVRIRDKCPSMFDFGVLWPITARGDRAQRPCPAGQFGIATRKCSEKVEWTNIETSNCTIPYLIDIWSKLQASESFDSMQISRLLLNATKVDLYYVTERNYDIVISVLRAILRQQQQINNTALKDITFARNILTISDRIISRYVRDWPSVISDHQFNSLLLVLDEFGSLMMHSYQRIKVLTPFQFIGSNFVFAVDRYNDDVNNRRVASLKLPKYDNFVVPSSRTFPFLMTSASHSKRNSYFDAGRFEIDFLDYSHNLSSVFYMFVRNDCRNRQKCLNPVVSFHGLTSKPSQVKVDIIDRKFHQKNATNLHNSLTSEFFNGLLRVAFPIREKTNSGKLLDCAYLSHLKNLNGNNGENSLNWLSSNAVLIGLNATHIVCQFGVTAQRSTGLFTVSRRPGDQSSLDFSLASGSYMPPFCAALTLFLCLVSLCAAVLRQGIRTRFVRCILICLFLLNASTFFFLQRSSIATLFCPLRNAILTLSVAALFAWLFIYAFHIYRILVVGVSKNCIVFSLLTGVLAPMALAILSFSTQKTCTLAHSSLMFWLLFAPPLLFCLLSFYTIVTSTLISLSNTNKAYDYAFSKFSIRTSLLKHSILIILCAIYNLASIMELFNREEIEGNFEVKFLTNILMVLAAICLFIWTNLPYQSSQNDCDVKSAQTLWVDDRVTTNLVHAAIDSNDSSANVPKYKIQDGRIYEGVPNEWMPDVIPTETYVHHTLQRSLLQTPQGQSPIICTSNRFNREDFSTYSPQHTPVRSVIPENSDELYSQRITPSKYYQNFGSPSPSNHFEPCQASGNEWPNKYDTFRHATHRCYGSASGSPLKSVQPTVGASSTLGRKGTKGKANMGEDGVVSRNSTMKFGTTVDDEMNDAYYTYTSRRSTRTPATTFN